MTNILPLEHLPPGRFDTPDILKKVTAAGRKLAELKGVAASIPNQGILVSTLGMQEAKDSSAIENIVTTHDELFQDDVLPESPANPVAKEVMRYRQRLTRGVRSGARIWLAYHEPCPPDSGRAGTELRRLAQITVNSTERWCRQNGLRAPARA